MNRELVRHLVEPLGVIVTEARGGAEAVAVERDSTFDLILMDVRMPEIDGQSAARLIRSRAGRKGTPPILAFTADIGSDMSPAGRDMFDGTLSKPIAGRDLVRVLAEHRLAPAVGRHRERGRSSAPGHS